MLEQRIINEIESSDVKHQTETRNFPINEMMCNYYKQQIQCMEIVRDQTRSKNLSKLKKKQRRSETWNKVKWYLSGCKTDEQFEIHKRGKNYE